MSTRHPRARHEPPSIRQDFPGLAPPAGGDRRATSSISAVRSTGARRRIRETNVVKRIGSSEILHDVVEHKGVLNVAGVVAEDLSLGMEGQARQVFAEIDRLLAANGSDRDHLLSAL